jgi:CheY-like chemotaxis protein
MSSGYHFIIIDDNELDLFIIEKFLGLSEIALSIQCFSSAEDGLHYFEANGETIHPSIILLGLQMPVMNGFDFVEAYASLDDSLRNKITIYILSSTVDRGDIERIKQNPFIVDLISKPLDVDVLKQKLELHFK